MVKFHQRPRWACDLDQLKDHRFLPDLRPEPLISEETETWDIMSRIYNRRQKDADEAHRIQVKAGLLVSRS